MTWSRQKAVESPSLCIQQALTSIHGARYMAVSRQLFSIAAWAWPSNRCSIKASAAPRSNSRFRSSEPSRWRLARSGPRAKSSTVAVVLARQKAESPTPEADCSRTVRRRASFSRANASQCVNLQRAWSDNSLPQCPFCAKCGHRTFHSNNSSARPDSGSGTEMPSAFAVFRLMYSSILVACCTGRSAGLSPLRIRPA